MNVKDFRCQHIKYIHVLSQTHTHFMSGSPPLKEQFIAQLEIVLKRCKSIKITIEEQWASESEMKNDLGWSQPLSLYHGLFMSCYFVDPLHSLRST